MLFAMKAEWVRGFVGDTTQVELGNQPFLAVANLPLGHFNAQLQQILPDGKRIEHFNGGRVKRACPEVGWNIGTGFQYHDVNAFLGQR